MKRLLSCSVALVALSCPAFAADLATRYPVKAPVVAPPVFSWTGFYLGANIGGAWSDGRGTVTLVPYATGPLSGSGSGFVYGGQAGYNYQIGSWVVGLETDIQGFAGSGSLSGIAGVTPFGDNADVDYFGTIRARLGYAWDRVLVYATGGAAYGKNTIDGFIGTTPYDASATYWTWTAGAGVEYAFLDNWTVKAEYLFIGTPNKVATIPGTVDVSGHVNSNVARVGLNYKF